MNTVLQLIVHKEYNEVLGFRPLLFSQDKSDRVFPESPKISGGNFKHAILHYTFMIYILSVSLELPSGE